MSSNNNTKLKVFGGFLAGAVVGSITALLLAPTSGKESRKRIASKSKELQDNLSKSIQKGIEEFKTGYNKGISTAAEVGKKSIDTLAEKMRTNGEVLTK